MKKISIIVPVYNVYQYLDDCINSLLHQDVDSKEIILIDDGSYDGSERLCDQYKEQYKDIKVIHQRNKGQSAARNAGIRIAEGEYILFVDSDDWISHDACEKMYNIAREYDADVVWGDLINKPRESIAGYTNQLLSGQEFIRRSLEVWQYDIALCLKMIRRDFIVKNDIYFIEGYYYEDQEYTFKLLLYNPKVIKIDFPFYYYRMDREGSTTNTYSIKKGSDLIDIIHYMIDEMNSFSFIETSICSFAKAVIALSVYHLSQVWTRMNRADRKTIIQQCSKQIRQYGLETKNLLYRIKIQNRLFLYCPIILILLSKTKNKLNRLQNLYSRGG